MCRLIRDIAKTQDLGGGGLSLLAMPLLLIVNLMKMHASRADLINDGCKRILGPIVWLPPDRVVGE